MPLPPFRNSLPTSLLGAWSCWWTKKTVNEGDLVLAADHVTPEAINFMARFGRGLICLTLTREHCEAAATAADGHARNGTRHGTAFTVSIEAATGVTTGISAADRAAPSRYAVAPDVRG